MNPEKKITVKDFNKVVEQYDSMLSKAHREIIFLNAILSEQNEELEGYRNNENSNKDDQQATI